MNHRPQRAQAMIEFLIIIPVLVLLIFGAVQAALIYSTKTGLNYATFQAARIGAMNNAQYDDMRRGLLRGMYPMFSQIEDPERRMEITAEEIDNYVLITRINPDSAAFSAWAVRHADPLGNGEDQLAIPNDNLMYRPMQQSPVSIQDANLLKIRVQYCARLIVPIVDRLLSSGSRFVHQGTDGRESASFRDISRTTSSNYGDVCRDRKGFVVSAETTLRMQSPAVDDEQCATGRLICP